MPFELGLACSLKVADPAAYEVFVLDSRPYRIDKTLSDYKGRDPLIHDGTCDGIVACLLDTFVVDVPDAAAQFRSAARDLRKSARLLKLQMKASTLFRPALFRLVVAAATDIAIARGFIRRSPLTSV